VPVDDRTVCPSILWRWVITGSHSRLSTVTHTSAPGPPLSPLTINNLLTSVRVIPGTIVTLYLWLFIAGIWYPSCVAEQITFCSIKVSIFSWHFIVLAASNSSIRIFLRVARTGSLGQLALQVTLPHGVLASYLAESKWVEIISITACHSALRSFINKCVSSISTSGSDWCGIAFKLSVGWSFFEGRSRI